MMKQINIIHLHMPQTMYHLVPSLEMAGTNSSYSLISMQSYVTIPRH
jgi:hypothetical protein